MWHSPLLLTIQEVPQVLVYVSILTILSVPSYYSRVPLRYLDLLLPLRTVLHEEGRGDLKACPRPCRGSGCGVQTECHIRVRRELGNDCTTKLGKNSKLIAQWNSKSPTTQDSI